MGDRSGLQTADFYGDIWIIIMYFKAYGKWVSISVGVAITGALWFARPWRGYRAEDVAELQAGVIERELIYRLTGDECAISNSYADIGGHILWSRMYDQVLCGARNLATNVDTHGVFWLPPGIDIADGDNLYSVSYTNAYVEWGRTNEPPHIRTYTFGPPLNMTEHKPTTASLADDEEAFIAPRTPRYQLPLVARGLEGRHPEFESNTVSSSRMFGDYCNWWESAGFTNGVFNYDFEFWEGLDDRVVNVSIDSNVHFELSTNQLFFAWDDDSLHKLTVHSKNNDKNRMHAEIVRISYIGNICNVVASDAGNIENLNIYFAGRTRKVAQGSEVTLALHPASDIEAEEYIVWQVFGDCITVRPQGGGVFGNTLYWGGNENPAWDTPQTVVIKALTNGTEFINGAIIRFQRSSQPGVYQDFPVGVTPIETSEELVVNPPQDVFFFSQKLGESTAYIGVTNDVPELKTSRYISDNKLDNAWQVLTNLSRSVMYGYYADPNTLMATQIVTRVVNASTNVALDEIGSQSDWFKISTAVAGVNAVLGGTPVSVTNAGSVVHSVLDISAGGYVNGDWSFDHLEDSGGSVEYEYGKSAWYASALTRLNEYYGVRTPYPSYYAITNGYVNKFEVYGVFEYSASVPWATVDVQSDTNGANFSYSFTYDFDDVLDINHYSNYLFGVVSDAAVYAELECLPHNKEIYETRIESNYAKTNAPLMLLASIDCSALTAGDDYPLFDIVRAPATISLAAGDYHNRRKQQDYSWTQNNDYGNSSVFLEEIRFENDIRLTHFLILVDWSWDHCNPDKPFEPEINVPQWTKK